MSASYLHEVASVKHRRKAIYCRCSLSAASAFKKRLPVWMIDCICPKGTRLGLLLVDLTAYSFLPRCSTPFEISMPADTRHSHWVYISNEIFKLILITENDAPTASRAFASLNRLDSQLLTNLHFFSRLETVIMHAFWVPSMLAVYIE